ncbi:lymphocyte function-associated antigen 3 [Tenrec ecaudatus]|uniref:lymphocyte function-associated antigen 3 n=1 Tax=Tenrec ecaudatus TaxID=94439 RepID=UPI003F5ABC94
MPAALLLSASPVMAAARAPGHALAVFWLGVCPLLWDLTRCASVTCYGVVGEEVTLSPLLDGKVFKDITWKKQKDKVIEWFEGFNETDFPPFTGRVVLDRMSGNLTIFNLTSSDEDVYEVELSDQRTTITLLVLELLPLPLINCTVNEESIRVRCVIPEHYTRHLDLIKYSWACPSAQCNDTVGNELHFNTSHFPKEVHCTISNHVSKRSQLIALETCVPKETSRNHWCALGAALAVAVVIIVIRFSTGQPKTCWKTERTNSS